MGGGGGGGGLGGVPKTLICCGRPYPAVLNRLFTLCGWRGPPRKNPSNTPPGSADAKHQTLNPKPKL